MSHRKPRDTAAVKVVFRKDLDGTVFALFPEIEGARGMCTSYEHVGQHSSADYFGCIARSRPALPKEYAALKRELESIGYKLDVRRRA
jgi:hypothetical protein